MPTAQAYTTEPTMMLLGLLVLAIGSCLLKLSSIKASWWQSGGWGGWGDAYPDFAIYEAKPIPSRILHYQRTPRLGKTTRAVWRAAAASAAFYFLNSVKTQVLPALPPMAPMIILCTPRFLDFQYSTNLSIIIVVHVCCSPFKQEA